MKLESGQPQTIQKGLLRLKARVKEFIKGKDVVIDRVIISLLAGGHVLIEDLPGMGKTTLAYSLARSIEAEFSRIQFTSDLLPADVLGVTIYKENEQTFEFKKGPVFCNILLADEINRTTPKTQSSLLEVMDRGKVSMDGETFSTGNPFLVFATQNPVDFEGTFPLPDSQLDRFFMRLEMGYPSFEDERDILEKPNWNYDEIVAEPVLSLLDIKEYQQFVDQVFIESSVLDFLLRLIHATRTESEFKSGLSPRASLALKRASQARALYFGRDFIMPEDVQDLFIPVCSHRLSLKNGTSDPNEIKNTVIGILKGVLNSVEPPLD